MTCNTCDPCAGHHVGMPSKEQGCSGNMETPGIFVSPVGLNEKFKSSRSTSRSVPSLICIVLLGKDLRTQHQQHQQPYDKKTAAGRKNATIATATAQQRQKRSCGGDVLID
eukprot:scaffold3059_cov131-Amphora_coffeaeformis.AAC.6